MVRFLDQPPEPLGRAERGHWRVRGAVAPARYKGWVMEPQELYGLPLEHFTEERNALVKVLRTEGRRDQADEISKLRKPSVAAWAVNQLVRTQRREVAALFEAGDALQEAQAELLAGRGEPDALRDAVEAERAAVDRLTRKARGLLSSEGHGLSLATLERVSETLNAAALDKDRRSEVIDGCLERELHHVGLGGWGTGDPSQPGRRGESASKQPAAHPRAPRSRDKQARTAQSRVTRKAEAEAQRRSERSAKALKAAQSRRDRAAAESRRAEEALRDAEGALAGAEDAAAHAARELEELRRARGYHG